MIRNTHRCIGKPLKGFGAYSIAMQCPLAGGTAVFKARAMLQAINDTLAYNDRDICNSVGITLRQLPKTEIIKPTAVVYPNPANESVTVVVNAGIECAANFELINKLGQPIALYNLLDKPRCHLHLVRKHWRIGIYTYQIKCD
ncbi:MAG: hypothetical protein IPO27_08000 [Bacteroidetes bacterium]|nr:hypothetical protein [Bacteroidota bacterium]